MSRYSKNFVKPISQFAPSHNKVLNQSHESRSWLERRNEPLHLEQWSLYTNQVSLNKPESAHTTGNHLFSAIAKLRFEYLVYNRIKKIRRRFLFVFRLYCIRQTWYFSSRRFCQERDVKQCGSLLAFSMPESFQWCPQRYENYESCQVPTHT